MTDKVLLNYIENADLNSFSLKEDKIMHDSSIISKNEVFYELSKDSDGLIYLTNSDKSPIKIFFWASENELNFLNKEKVCKLAAEIKIQ